MAGYGTGIGLAFGLALCRCGARLWKLEVGTSKLSLVVFADG